MLFNYLNNPTVLIIATVIMVMALIFHNIVQTWVASRYGDNSARYAGFMNFDPQLHLEPMGVVFLFVFGFGWTKTVPINSRNYHGKGRQEAIVWYSGPLTYLVVALISFLLALVFARFENMEFIQGFAAAGNAAIIHAVINLFPVYPLDGAHAALAWGNPSVRRFIQQVQSYGFIGFIVIFMLLSYTGVTSAIANIFRNLIFTLLGFIPGL